MHRLFSFFLTCVSFVTPVCGYFHHRHLAFSESISFEAQKMALYCFVDSVYVLRYSGTYNLV